LKISYRLPASYQHSAPRIALETIGSDSGVSIPPMQFAG